MNLRKLLLQSISVFFLLLSTAANAQTKPVSGRVTDANGVGLAGVTVAAKGTNTVTTTSEDGSFSLAVPQATTALVFTSVGFERTEIALNNQTTFNVRLTASSSNLNEVVVVGYGTQRKRDVTASISKIGADKIVNVPAPSFESALAGKAAGVQVTTSNGLAGSGAVVRIRGINSISIAGDPLYVIDGLPIDVTYTGGALRNSLGQDRNPLANINPNDIESIEILKDAGAAGIYGSRGANGVILITTKRGRGKLRQDFSARVGVSGPALEPQFVDKDTWLAIRQEAWEFDGNTGLQQNLPGGNGGFPLQQALNSPGTDWWDEVTQVGFSQDYNYSIAKGIGKFNFFLGGNYGKEQSYVIGNDFRRAGARLNVDYKPLKNLTLSLNNAFYSGLNNVLNNGWNGGLGAAMSVALPYYPIKNPDGSYWRADNFGMTWHGFRSYNPVFQREETDYRNRENRMITSGTARYSPIKNLDIAGTVSYEQNNSLFNAFQSGYFLVRSAGRQGNAEDNFNKYKNLGTNLTVNYLWEINSNNRLTTMIGTEYQDQETQNRYAYLDSAAQPLYKGNISSRNDSIINAATFNTTYQRLFRSVFARLNYSLMDRYILQGSLRRDEASVFRDNYKVGWFPTVSAAWIVSSEDFFKNIKHVNHLKLRASWGLMGSANIPWDAGYASFDTSRQVGNNYNGQPTIFRTRLGNPNMKWETSSNIDVALEGALFNNRVSFEAGYYRKLSDDVLVFVPISYYNGLGQNQWQNQGSILNEGLEFSLTTLNVNRKDFKWRTNFNIAHNYNEVLSIGDLRPDAIGGGTNETRIVPGYPVGTIFTVRYYGVDPADGLPIFLDRSGKQTKVLDAPVDGRLGDRVPVANTLPQYVGGLTNTFTYKQWELNSVFTYQFGGYIWDNSGKRNLGWITDWNIYADYAGNYWRKPGDVAKYPRPTLRGYDQVFEPGNPWLHNSSIQVHKSDFVRLRELTLNYTLPKTVAQKFKATNARVFLSGYNLFLFTEYAFGDPESGRDGEDNSARNQSANANFLNPPLQRSFNFGVNLSF